MILHRLESDCLFFCCFFFGTCLHWLVFPSLVRLVILDIACASGLEPSSKVFHWFVFFAALQNFPFATPWGVPSR